MDKELKQQNLSLWRWILLGSPVWWALGLILFIYHGAAAWLLGMQFAHQDRKPIYLPSSVFYLALFCSVYFFSILIHASAESADRLLASSYNFSFWVMGIFLVLYFANRFALHNISDIYQTFEWFAILLAIFSFCAWGLVLLGIKQFSFPSLFYFLTGGSSAPALIRQSLNVMLLIFDWFARAERPRFNALSPYPTATAALFAITFFMVLSARSQRKPANLLFWAFTLLLCGWGFFMTFARMTVFAFGVSFVAVSLISRKNAWFWVVLLFGGCLFFAPLIAQGMSFFWGLREGSTSMRLDLYAYSLQQLRGAEWWIGLGVRPREEFFDFPIGSHSTYVSLIYRTGLIGFLAFLFLQVSLLSRWVSLKAFVEKQREQFIFWRGLGWIFFMMLFWMLTEDIDAPQLLVFIYFSFMGIFEGFRRRVLEHSTA